MAFSRMYRQEWSVLYLTFFYIKLFVIMGTGVDLVSFMNGNLLNIIVITNIMGRFYWTL